MEIINNKLDAILDAIKKSNAYIEVSEEQVRYSIRDYLLNEHDQEISALSLRMQLDVESNIEHNKAWYDQECKRIKSNFDKKISELLYFG